MFGAVGLIQAITSDELMIFQIKEEIKGNIQSNAVNENLFYYILWKNKKK